MLSSDDAIRFLNALDSNAKTFNFLTNRETDDLKVFKIEEHHGNLDSIWWLLENRNNRGCGVYVQINESRSDSRKAEDIVRVRAIWQEDDTNWEGHLPLPPSLTVQSSEGRYHRYWFGDLSAADFEACMRGLVHDYGSDPNAKDIARLLRLPGTVNWKRGGKHLARILWPKQGEPVRRYTREQLVEAFAKPKEPEPQNVIRGLFEDRCANIDDIQYALSRINADDRDVWLKVLMAVHQELGEDGYGICDEWSQTSNKYDPKEQRRAWDSFSSDHKNPVTIATVFALADANLTLSRYPNARSS